MTLSKIKEYENKTKELAVKIENFTGKSLKKVKIGKIPVETQIFWKLGLEKGIPAKYLCKYCGTKRTQTPNEVRRKFNQNMDIDIETKIYYYKIKERVNRI